MSGSEGEDYLASDQEVEDHAPCDGDQSRDIIWLPEDDDEMDLVALLTNTSSRKKTWDTYVAPRHLHDKVIRCREYPRGVYIDRFGKAQPHDARSNLYWTRSEWRRQHESVADAKGLAHGTLVAPPTTPVVHRDSMRAASQAVSVSKKVPHQAQKVVKRVVRRDSDEEDEDEDSEEEEETTESEAEPGDKDSDYTASETDEDSSDADESEESEEEEEPLPKKKRKQPPSGPRGSASASEQVVAQQGSKAQAKAKRRKTRGDSDSEDTMDTADRNFVVDSEEDEEVEEDVALEEVGTVERAQAGESAEALKRRRKRERLLRDLKRGAEQLNHMQRVTDTRRRQHIQAQALNERLGRQIEGWEKALRAAKRRRQPVPHMSFDSHFLTDTPSCTFVFEWRHTTPSPTGSRAPRWTARMSDASLRCTCACGYRVDELHELLPHLQSRTCPPEAVEEPTADAAVDISAFECPA